MSGNQVQGPPTAFESVGRQLADTFSLTRSHHRAYGPPAVSFSCLDIERAWEEPRPKHRECSLERRGKDFFEINRERRTPRSRERMTDVEKERITIMIVKLKDFHLISKTFHFLVSFFCYTREVLQKKNILSVDTFATKIYFL